MKIIKPDLYHYLDYRRYLSDLYHENKLANPSFSFRFMAMRMNLRSHNYIKLIIDGERRLNPALLEALAVFLDLNTTERRYLELLVDFEKAKSLGKKDTLVQQLQGLRQKKGPRVLSGEDLNVLDEWYYLPMLELLSLGDFQDEPRWLARRLKLTETQAAKAWRRLVKAGFIQKKAGGGWKKSSPAVDTKDEIAQYLVQRYHVLNLQAAAEKVFQQRVAEREYSSLTFSGNPALIQQLKEKLKKFRAELTEILSSPRQGDDQVYQLNFQMFRLTESPPMEKPKTDG